MRHLAVVPTDRLVGRIHQNALHHPSVTRFNVGWKHRVRGVVEQCRAASHRGGSEASTKQAAPGVRIWSTEWPVGRPGGPGTAYGRIVRRAVAASFAAIVGRTKILPGSGDVNNLSRVVSRSMEGICIVVRTSTSKKRRTIVGRARSQSGDRDIVVARGRREHGVRTWSIVAG